MNFTRTLRQWQKIRQTENELNRLSSRELDDLGISRADIPTIARQAIG
ncbi:MAG: DUF1127 domain-containing protein [Pseudomonadota bacterium]